ncbi:MAG: hypothetical protein J0M07_00785 [Anaerolineae bacterium]|nr:hypothetical protein [Anaerolineae bacterium]
MNTKQKQTVKHSGWAQAQSGQAIVLMALAFVVLIGALGLAVDGGGLFFLQRDAQNAADAAAIAGAYARCTSINSGNPDAAMQTAGQAAANANGFFNGVDGRAVTLSMPTEGPLANDQWAVQADISASKPSYFAQVVYRGPLGVTTRAIAYCQPPFNPASVPGIVGLSSTCGNTISWDGSDGEIRTSSAHPEQALIWSNNEIKSTAGTSGNDFTGLVQSLEETDPGNHDTFNPPYTGDLADQGYTALPDPLAYVYAIGQYAPGGIVAGYAPEYHAITHRGTDLYGDPDYNDANRTWSPSNRTLSGMYYVDGDINFGNNVTFAKPVNGVGGVSFIATGTIQGDHIEAQYYQYPRAISDNRLSGSTGVLFMALGTGNNPCSYNAVKISGETLLWGLIYAPNANVQLSAGNDGLVIKGALIANSVTLSGNHLVWISDPDVMSPQSMLVRVAE